MPRGNGAGKGAHGSTQASQAGAATGPRSALLGRWLGVPTSFFGVDIEGARYLAQVSQLHATKSSMVWMRFDADNKEVFAPHNVVARWLISDEEAKDESTEWHGLDDGCSEAESEEDEQVGAAQPRLPRNDGGLRGAVKSGRWQPAAAAKSPHAVDSATWKKAAGPVPTHKPLLHERAPPPGKTWDDIPQGLQQKLTHGKSVGLQLFQAQWDIKCWKLIEKYSKLRAEQLGVGTADSKSYKPNMDKRADGSAGQPRALPGISVAFLVRLHVIQTVMGLIRLPARKYYWASGRKFMGVLDVKKIMSQTSFEQGMRCLYSCDYMKLIPRGDRKQPPPEGYDKMAKTRELNDLIMANTLNAYHPPKQISDDECSEPWGGKNGEGASVSFNKDKPHPWATRVQTFNSLDSARIVWHVLNCPRREAAEHGETHLSTLALVAKVHAKYGSGFEVGQDSLYNSPVVVVDASVKYKWNMYGTVGWNRRGIETDADMPPEERGSHVSYYTSVTSEGMKVPLTYTLLKDNKVVRFLSSVHGIPTPANGTMKPRWNKSIREYQEVYIPPVKISYDKGKVGSDLFGQYMEILESTFKTYHPWMAHHFWLWNGCFVNAHVYRNRLIDNASDPAVDNLKKRTLVEDTLEILEELLAYADKLEREAHRIAQRRGMSGGENGPKPVYSPGGRECFVSRLGSPTRHLPCKFLSRGRCLVCRNVCRGGCGNEECGHLCTIGGCWKEWHSAKIDRQSFKAKRKAPVIDVRCSSLPSSKRKCSKRRSRGHMFSPQSPDE